ncbi:unnamed protein product [Trichobilharzia szidati]|nr:unnamed protein product [Trichobilharzia szidati]
MLRDDCTRNQTDYERQARQILKNAYYKLGIRHGDQSDRKLGECRKLYYVQLDENVTPKADCNPVMKNNEDDHKKLINPYVDLSSGDQKPMHNDETLSWPVSMNTTNLVKQKQLNLLKLKSTNSHREPSASSVCIHKHNKKTQTFQSEYQKFTDKTVLKWLHDKERQMRENKRKQKREERIRKQVENETKLQRTKQAELAKKAYNKWLVKKTKESFSQKKKKDTFRRILRERSAGRYETGNQENKSRNKSFDRCNIEYSPKQEFTPMNSLTKTPKESVIKLTSTDYSSDYQQQEQQQLQQRQHQQGSKTLKLRIKLNKTDKPTCVRSQYRLKHSRKPIYRIPFNSWSVNYQTSVDETDGLQHFDENTPILYAKSNEYEDLLNSNNNSCSMTKPYSTHKKQNLNKIDNKYSNKNSSPQITTCRQTYTQWLKQKQSESSYRLKAQLQAKENVALMEAINPQLLETWKGLLKSHLNTPEFQRHLLGKCHTKSKNNNSVSEKSPTVSNYNHSKQLTITSNNLKCAQQSTEITSLP